VCIGKDGVQEAGGGSGEGDHVTLVRGMHEFGEQLQWGRR
jgi:hypothetical protein